MGIGCRMRHRTQIPIVFDELSDSRDGAAAGSSAGRHSQGGNFSFADGHVEHWRWVTPKIFTELGQFVRQDGELQDFLRVQQGVKPETRF